MLKQPEQNLFEKAKAFAEEAQKIYNPENPADFSTFEDFYFRYQEFMDGRNAEMQQDRYKSFFAVESNKTEFLNATSSISWAVRQSFFTLNYNFVESGKDIRSNPSTNIALTAAFTTIKQQIPALSHLKTVYEPQLQDLQEQLQAMKKEINAFFEKSLPKTDPNMRNVQLSRGVVTNLNQRYQQNEITAAYFLMVVQHRIAGYKTPQGHKGGLSGKFFRTSSLDAKTFDKIAQDPTHTYAYFLGQLRDKLQVCERLEKAIKASPEQKIEPSKTFTSRSAAP